jgi:type I restriction enzyme S subunit
MSRIDDLMRELCPEGVPLALLGDGVNNRDNERRPVTRELRQSGIYPYYGANGVQDYVQDFIFDGEFLLVGEDGSVIEASGAPVLNWAEGKIWVNNHAHVLQERTGGPILRFLYFYLSTINVSAFVTGGSQKKINQGNLNNIPIPRPPLEVQREIVSILDKFTQLEAELDAELEARRSQYEHTRDQLLDFSGDLSHHPLRELIAELCPEGVASPRLDEVFEIRGGFTPPKANPGLWSDGTVPWFRMEDIRENGRVLNGALQNVSEKALKESGAFSANSIIVSTSATIGEHALITVPFLANQRFTVLTIKSGYLEVLLPKFAFYLGFPLSYYCTQNTVKSGFAGVEMVAFRSFPIPLPPLEVQRKIVSILDKLDALVNDLTFGLPAEITARRKQYEYYRNKLLTFKELETA